MAAMYIPIEYRVAEQQMQEEVRDLEAQNYEFEDVPIDLLIKIDWVYHHHENNYDGGLSFLDRLNNKIGQFLNVNIDNLKLQIRSANDPQNEYRNVVHNLLRNREDRMYYGL